MRTLDELLRTPADTPLHPRLRHWKRRLAQPGCKVELELFRPETGLGIAQTDMILHFAENGKLLPVETVDWDDDLNTGLIQMGARSISAEQESKRFALGLRGALRKAGREFGDGYLNSMLFDFLSDTDFVRYPEIAGILKHINAQRPKRDGEAADQYNLCREMIEDAIGGRAHELKAKLGYPDDEAKAILVQAVTRYLDERFSFSYRRRNGLI